jgi:4'-phosphopantetheinyl transferase
MISIISAMPAERGLVEVFVVPIEPVCQSAMSLLSPAELLRLSEMRREAARNEFVSLRFWLRALLCERLGCVPQSVPILATPGSPPVAPRSGWHFSLTHSTIYGMVALSRSGPIGIDIEADQHVQDAMSMACNFFHPSERDWISSHRPDTRSAAFLQIWVRKEAVVKAIGQGLATGLDSWSVLKSPNGVEPRVDVELHGQVWRVHALAAPHGHFAALAIRCLDARIQWHQMPPRSAFGPLTT